MYYKLEMYEGVGGSSIDAWNLTLPATVGRGEDCQILVNDPSISRQHCRFSVNAYGAVVVHDLGSTNGVYVRDERVKEATIIVGEPFQIGGMTFTVDEISQPIQERKRGGLNDAMLGTRRVADIYEIP